MKTLKEKKEDKLYKCPMCKNEYCTLEEIYFKEKDVEKCFKDILNKIDKKIKGTFMTKELSYNDIEEIIKNESGFNK